LGNWTIRWNFNKATYSPGENAYLSLWLENTGDTHLYLSDFKLNFDFGTYELETISGMIPPGNCKFLGNTSLQLPKNLVGRRIFTLDYHIHEYISGAWVDLGSYTSDKQYFISIYPTPLYKVFVSRGLLLEDRAMGDPIAEMIREWGFQTVTVGIEVQVPEALVPTRVKEEIKSSDAVIAIATPRFMDALTGLWKTLEWLHGEVGIGFGIDKPLLILKDRRVSLAGLPSYLAELKLAPVIEFDEYDMEKLRRDLSTVMPGFRGWTETRRKQEFWNSLRNLIIGGLAVVGLISIISGFMGSHSGTSKK